MTIVITDEIAKAFEEYQNEIVDWYMDGMPIRRKDCGYFPNSIVDFAAGFQAAVHLSERNE